jgi:hypothetical protein
MQKPGFLSKAGSWSIDIHFQRLRISGTIRPPGHNCSQSLTMSENQISNIKITASVMNWWAAKARLYQHQYWCSDQGQWLQVDFGKNMHITKVATQGGYHSWVTSYDLSYKTEEGNWHFQNNEKVNQI